MKSIPAFLCVLLSGPTLLSLSACNNSPTPKPPAQTTDSAVQAAVATPPVLIASMPPDSGTPKAEGESFGGFEIEEEYLIPWEDESTPLTDADPPRDSLLVLEKAFRNYQQRYDTIIFFGPEHDTLSKLLGQEFDFRVCGGSENFSTLKGIKMREAMLLGSAPKPGFTYRIVGKGGELMPPALRFDSMRVNVFSNHDNEDIGVPVWTASAGDSALNKQIGAMKGKAMILGSKSPLRNAAVKPAPISDSLKLLILKSLVPDESTLAIFSQTDFYSAGADDARMRCIVLLGGEMYAVEVANGTCEVLFRVNSRESKAFLYPLSLTDTPVADVFVIRINETALAFLKKNGKWTYANLEYNDPYNWGC